MSTPLELADDSGVPPDGHRGPCWMKILSFEPQKLKEFYAALFPSWTFRATTKEVREEHGVYYEFLSRGIVRKIPEDNIDGEQLSGVRTTVYYFVKSMDETEKRVLELGGATTLERRGDSVDGWYTTFKDPEGNQFGGYEVDMEMLE